MKKLILSLVLLLCATMGVAHATKGYYVTFKVTCPDGLIRTIGWTFTEAEYNNTLFYWDRITTLAEYACGCTVNNCMAFLSDFQITETEIKPSPKPTDQP